MLRRTIATVAAAALCATSFSPALAQDRLGAFEAPQGAVATVNLRMPLGGRSETRRPTIGFTVDYRYADGGMTLDGRRPVRLRLADLRLGGDGIDRIELASFDLANPDRDGRLNLIDVEEDGKKKTWIAMALVLGGIAACVFEFCFSDEDSDDSTADPPVLGD